MTGRRSKVERLIEERDLDGLGDELVDGWTATGDDRTSLRDLARRFNVRLLAATMDRAGGHPPVGDPGSVYAALNGVEGVSAGRRAEVRSQLDRAGIDVDELERSFVTYQAIRTYVTDVRGAERGTPDDAERIDSVRTTIQRLTGRTSAVAEENLERLRETGRLPLGDFRLTVDVRVYCRDCGAQRDVIDLIDEGGCECE